MNCQEIGLDVGDYVDRTLPPAQVGAVDAHLAGCEHCRALVADLRTLGSVAASLERRTPPPHVWTRIAATLEQETAPRAWWNPFAAPFIGWRPLLASGVLVMLLTAATWLTWREVSTVQSARQGGSGTADTVVQTGPLDATQALTSQITHLEGIVDAGAAVLPGETKTAYQVNDAVLEQAIGHSRAALASTPSDDLAQQSLFEALGSKLALLQDMVALINEMRKGNQEGAARIISGMEQ